MIVLSSLRIASKLGLMILIAALGIVAVAGVSQLQLGNALEKGHVALANSFPSMNLVNGTRASFHDLRAQALYHVLHTDTNRMREIDTQIAETRLRIGGALAHYRESLVVDEEDARLLDEVSAAIEDYYGGLDVALGLSRTSAGSVSAAARNALEQQLPKVERVHEAIDRILEYNATLAARSSAEALAARGEALRTTVILTALLLLLLGVAAWLIGNRGLAQPIGAVVDNLAQLAAGSLEVTIAGVERRDEVGDIARAAGVFKAFVQKLDIQRWVSTHTGDLATALQQAEDFGSLARVALSMIAPLTGAGHGAFHVRDAEDGFTLQAGYGHHDRGHASDRFLPGEGLVGQCAIEKTPIVVTAPVDYIRISSGLGEGAPASIVLLPIVHSERVLGVLELASFRPFSEREQALLDAVAPLLASTMEILDRNLRTRELLTATQQQAERMEKQAAQLEEQSVEMEAQQAELRETESWFRSIIDMSPDGMLVVDAAGRILLANPAVEQIFGYAPGELIGGPVDQLVPDRVRERHPALRASFMQESRSRAMSESPDLSGLRKDGSEVGVAITLSPLPPRGHRGRCVSVAVRVNAGA